MRKLLIPSALILFLSATFAIGQVTKSLQGSQDPRGPVGLDASNNAYFPAHVNSQGGTPALTSCGVSPTIVGSDMAGVVTVKTTTCTITFAAAYTNAPACVVVDETTPSLSMAYTVTTAHIAISAGLTSSDLVQYICIGQSGG